MIVTKLMISEMLDISVINKGIDFHISISYFGFATLYLKENI